MSYDIHFACVTPGQDPLTEARRRCTEDEEPESDASEDLRRRGLVDDLLALHPALRMEPNPELGFSHGCWIGADDDGCPIPDIEVGVRSGSVSISYSADPRLLEAIDLISTIFGRHGHVAYDPQTDALWEPTAGRARFVGTRDAVVTWLQRRGERVIGIARSAPDKRPWWRFW